MELIPTNISDLYENQIIDFGKVVLSDDDIIKFATLYDPMPFHIDKEMAEKSYFKGLIASGPHLFYLFYNREWMPRFKHTVFAGKGMSNWELKKPVYSNVASNCKIHIKKIAPKPVKDFILVDWYFEFTNENNEILQHLNLIVLHHIEK